jgi:hypothetical protein
MKNDKIIIGIVCVLLVFTSYPAEGKITITKDTNQTISVFDIDREEAIQILINEVIKPETLDHEIIAFGLEEPLSIGDHISPHLPAEWPWNVSEIPYLDGGVTLNRAKWFFWVDDMPMAEYDHDTRFVYIDAETGLPTVTYEDWWCLINGEPKWVDQDEYLNPSNWVFSNYNRASEQVIQVDLKIIVNTHIFSNAPKKDNSSGLVVNGWSQDQREGAFQPNAENMTDVFNAMGLNTTSMGPNTSPRATEANILSYLYGKAQQLVACEDLFIYITGHGTNGGNSGSDYGSIVINNTRLYVAHLQAALKKFRPGVHIYIQIQSCYSGQFTGMSYCEGIDASAQGKTSDGEGSTSHGGRTKAWVDDYKKLLANQSFIDKLKEIAANGHYSWRGLLYREAKKSAKTDDPDTKLPKNQGRTNPVDQLYTPKHFIQKAANETKTLWQNAVGPDEKEKLGRAYEHLSSILADGVWIDEEHIETTKGDLVFTKAGLALQELENIDSDAEFRLEESIIIVELLMNVIDIAEDVSIAAQGIVPLNLNMMHQITKKQADLKELMTEGIGQLNASDIEGNSTFSEVIPFYQDVWTAAQNILRIAQRPPLVFQLPLTWAERLELINQTFMEIYNAKLLQLNTPDVGQANLFLQKADAWYTRGMHYFGQGNLIFARIFLELAKAKASKANALLKDHTTPDTIPPEIVITNPVNGQESVPVTSLITITFSESMNKLSVHQAISLSPEIPFNTTWDEAAKTITITPTQQLMFNTAYVVEITTEAEDVAANHLKTTYTFSFTTESNEDTIPPESWALPPGGSVYPDTPIQIYASDEGGSGVFYIHYEVWYLSVPVHIEEYYGNLVEFQFQQYGIYEGSVDLIFWAMDNAGNPEMPTNICNYLVIY